MAAGVNQIIADALTRRRLHVLRAEATRRREIWGLLALLERDLLALLKVHDPLEGALLARRLRLVTTLVDEELTPLVQQRYRQITTGLTPWLVALAQQEVERTLPTVQAIDHPAAGLETPAGAR